MHPLDEPRPSFLDELDSDREAAAREFYDFATRLLRSNPPWPLTTLSHDSKQDFIQEFIIYCTEDNFARLRKYKNEGKPFARWLYVTSHNFCLNFLKKGKVAPRLQAEYREYYRARATRSNLDPDERAFLVRLIEAVQECISMLDARCQELLMYASDGLKPSEISSAINRPDMCAKKVSDHLGYCRKQLVELLFRRGINIEDWIR